ncbi:DUF1735 domain-containing protein [Flavobacterium sp. UMI-01]|uniref:DUF1735 domain-containing protein n=1 Tax=Flavobacterium sp. UMI-01 TaxID=1441053 RepID=UPI001C7D25B5|nr:DUF1735 domain-containing protein [Flavobacterium sp. UMI-01]GIZ09712.1 hypothetical protein FUMI01_24390 [Flavobacterium sp. UMI-01]
MKKIIAMLGLISFLITSCEPYEDFTGDFDKTIVYFGTQKPLRTVVAYDEMKFKVGVTFGGKRSNDKEEFADFVVDPTLLTTVAGANAFTLLPQNYYTLSNSSKMVIPAGSFIGDVTVTLNRDLFTADAGAINNTYALPLKITNTSLDSIASGSKDVIGNVILEPRDYTIVVVKYISPYTGTFYHKGVQKELDANGAVVNEVVYSNSDLIKNTTWDIKTIDRNSVRTPGIGTFTNQNFAINVNESDNTVTIDSPSAGVTNLVGTGSYNKTTRTFSLQYSFTLGGKKYQVTDELIVRRPPEQDLVFETW